MIKLSFEIPLKHVEEYTPLEDFQFGLAQHFLLDDPLNKRYQELYQGCLLDNGMYELGEPYELEELMEAAHRARPWSVIAPDWMNDMTRTVLAAVKLVDATTGKGYNVGGVVQGNSMKDRIDCFKELRKLSCRPLCFPFRTNRMDTIQILHELALLRDTDRYHLLGLQDIRELTWYNQYPGHWALDTGKPFKGFKLTDPQIRGKGRLDFMKDMTIEEHTIALWNIAYMRRLANA